MAIEKDAGGLGANTLWPALSQIQLQQEYSYRNT